VNRCWILTWRIEIHDQVKITQFRSGWKKRRRNGEDVLRWSIASVAPCGMARDRELARSAFG
jgi:hypothetical protein